MSIFKKFAAPLVAVALVAVMGVSLLSATRTAEAAITVTTAGDVAVTTAAAGTAFTAVISLDSTEQTAAGSTLVVTAPAGFIFTAAPAVAVSGTGATLVYGAAAATVTAGAVPGFFTYTAGTLNTNAGATTLTITGNLRNAGPGLTATAPTVSGGTAGGSSGIVTVSGVDLTTTTIATLTTAYVSPFTIVMATAPVGVTSVPADGSIQITVSATVTDASGIVVANRPVAWTVSVGAVSTGTAKTGTSFTAAATGTATQTYRGAGGVATTDTIIAAVSTGNAVGTLSMQLTAPSGSTAAKLVIVSPSVLAIAPAINNVSPAYSSPTTGAHVAVQSQDAAGLGVNGQVILLSVDRGAIVANPAFGTASANTICNGVTANSITQNTASTNLNAPGATANSAGYVNFTVCADQTDAAGTITVTAQNVSTSMANATTTLSHAGRPNKITATVTGSAIAVKVTDSAGNNVADGTPVRFTMSQNAGAVSTGCTTSTNGAASAVVALVAPTGTVIVSADWFETGTFATAATCTGAPGAGTQQIATSAVIGAGGTGGTGGTTGAGTFASTPVYSSGKLAQVVFNGGTVAQLETAVSGANGSGVWAQTSTGAFVLDIIGGGFVNDAFKAAFPNGFAGVTAVTVVGK